MRTSKVFFRVIFFSSFLVLQSSFCIGQQGWQWVNMSTGIHSSGEGVACATDIDGNAYLTGCFISSDYFGRDSLKTKAGCSALCIVKYDSNGNVKWARQSTNGSYIEEGIIGNSVIVDKKGNVYVAGQFWDSLFIGAYKFLTPGLDYFLVKYTKNGNLSWAKIAKTGSKSNNYIFANSVTLDSKDNIYITGEIYNSIDTIGPSVLSGVSFFIAKYDSGGNALWAKEPSSNFAVGNSITADKRDNIYVAGFYTDNFNIGLKTLTSAGEYEVFLAKFDANGNNIWAIQSDSGKGDRRGYSVAVDNSFHPYVTGLFTDTLSFRKDSLNSLYKDFFIAKFDSSGKSLWIHSGDVWDSVNWTGWALATDTLNHVYFSGSPYDTYSGNFHVAYGIDTFNVKTTGGDGPSLLMQLDTSGTLLCADILNGGGDDNNYICSNPSGGNIYIGGDLIDNAIFGKDTVKPKNEALFIAKWNPCGKSTASIAPIIDRYSISLFPNPNNGIFTLQMNSEEIGAKNTIEIYNVLGEKVLAETLHFAQGDNLIDLTAQPNGIYLYRILKEDGELIGSGKVIIDK